MPTARADRYPPGLTFDDLLVHDIESQDLADAMRAGLRDEYAHATDAELQEALDNVLEAMSPAEGFNFSAALNQLGKSAGRLASDPTFQAIAKTAAPIAGGALGTFIGGPVGAALGSQLGTLAANALPAPAAPPPGPAAAPAPAPAPPPAPPVPAAFPPPPTAAPAPAAAPTVAAPPAGPPPVAAPTPAAATPSVGATTGVSGGSAAAAQGLVLTQQPDVLRGLLATALGEHGRREVSGVPVAQVLSMLSQVFGQAAADADELAYLEQESDQSESSGERAPDDAVEFLYADLLGADNLELAEAAGWDGVS